MPSDAGMNRHLSPDQRLEPIEDLLRQSRVADQFQYAVGYVKKQRVTRLIQRREKLTEREGACHEVKHLHVRTRFVLVDLGERFVQQAV